MTNAIKWRFAERTMHTDREAENLEKAIRETCTIAPEGESNLLSNFVYILSTTEVPEFDATHAKPSLRDLPAFLLTWRDMAPADVWEYRVRRVSHNLWVEWANAFTADTGLFEADEAAKPTRELTPEQQAEAANPNSPLA